MVRKNTVQKYRVKISKRAQDLTTNPPKTFPWVMKKNFQLSLNLISVTVNGITLPFSLKSETFPLLPISSE